MSFPLIDILLAYGAIPDSFRRVQRMGRTKAVKGEAVEPCVWGCVVREAIPVAVSSQMEIREAAPVRMEMASSRGHSLTL